jgi:UDP-N-acetylmuramate dehydrogenase
MRILENVLLKDLTTFKVGGNARFFVAVQNESDLVDAVRFAHNHNVPFFVLGGGSNIVISDQGFGGLVIKMEIGGFAIDEEGSATFVTVGAGESWDATVEKSVIAGLSGIENLSHIPGTVGAAPVQNIGAYGVEIKDVLTSVRVYDTEREEFALLTRDQCEFSYRDSIFKKDKKLIVVSITLQLSRDIHSNLNYKDIQEYIENGGIDPAALTPLDIRVIVTEIRTRKLPNWLEVPTAGSFFKNPDISEESFAVLKKTYPELPGYVTNKDVVKIPLAWIIEHVCGLKGSEYGGAAIYEKHALVIINKNNATSSDIRELARRVTLCVFEKTDIVIENEVQFVES